MLMAAGLGTRLRPMTEVLPKPLVPLMGVPMIQYAVDLALEAGVSQLVANIHHLPEKSRRGFAQLDLRTFAQGEGIPQLSISDESTQLLGSAGGIKKALPLLGEGPFLLLNSDVLCDLPIQTLLRQHQVLRRRFGVTMTLALRLVRNAHGRYREIRFDSHSQLVTGVGELVEGRPYFSGVAVVEPEALAAVPPQGAAEFLPSILLPETNAHRVGAYLFEGDWFDIGSPMLWQKTHLELMRRLETGSLRGSWRRRIETASRRVSSEIWVAGRDTLSPDVTSWQNPCFWGKGHSTSALAPLSLSKGSVVYGELLSPADRAIVSFEGAQSESF